VLALTRQSVPQLRLGHDDTNRCAAGAYEIVPAVGNAIVSLFASGSEVAIAIEARKYLRQHGVAARVVSVPCFELFLAAPEDVREAILGEARVKVAVEAGVRQAWDQIIGSNGVFIGLDDFGASAPYRDLYHHFGLTAEAVAEAALMALGADGARRR